jgi:two-component system, chemotaxis family, protein-glutamate methylesterase/glutaminase
MTPIRVLIVDDSVIARRLITNALSAHAEVAVVGTAENGALALTKLPQLSPDAVILDVEMPEMDGITTLKFIRERYPKLPVIMFSTQTERGARTTFDALAAGANDYALKPSAQSGESLDSVIRDVLVPKLVSIVRAPQTVGHGRASRSNGSGTYRPVQLAGPHAARPHILALAAATGGPNALADVIPLLPADLPVPVLVVQHMPAVFTRCLAERLDERSQLRVHESQGNEILMPGHVYIAPGGYHLEVVRDGDQVRTQLSTAAPEHGTRPAADVLFRSLATAYGANTLAVVLTGMGSDGKLGAREIVAAGGRIIAQSGGSCVVWGMPRAVEEAGLCEAVVPLHDIASAIRARVEHVGSSVDQQHAHGS